MAAATAVGLDIGTSAVRAAELSVGRADVGLRRFGQVALPSGAVRDGEVADPQTVAAAIRQLWTTSKISSKKVVVGIANQRVIVRQVDLPWLPVKELRESLAFQVQDFLPIPVEQAILDFHPVEEVTDDSGARLLRVLLVAAARDMVVGFLDAVQQAGLTPVQVDLTPFAVLRSLAAVEDSALGGVDAEALVDVGAGVTNIVVHENGVPRFVRVLLMGGDALTAALAERLGIPLEEAEQAKRQMGLPELDQMHFEAHPGVRALDAAAAALVDEIRGSLDYYLAQPTAVPVRRLVLSGGGAQLRGLTNRLSAATRLEVVAGSAAGRLTPLKGGVSTEQLASAAHLLTVPVGLAMGVAS